jgi:hypothetical protein
LKLFSRDKTELQQELSTDNIWMELDLDMHHSSFEAWQAN